MSFIIYKSIAGLLILVTSLISVIYPVRVRAKPEHRPALELADAFASGVFLGAALFHMLPDAIQDFQRVLGDINYPLAELFCAFGFILLLFLERVSVYLPFFKKSEESLPYMIALILIIHSLIEGIALGINTIIETVFVIFLAVIVHKGSESFALAVILNRSQLKLKRIIWIIVLFSLMTPVGIALGAIMTDSLHSYESQIMTAGFNAFAAGTFLYMSTLHHINHHHRLHDAENIKEFVLLFLGITIMALLALWA